MKTVPSTPQQHPGSHFKSAQHASPQNSQSLKNIFNTKIRIKNAKTSKIMTSPLQTPGQLLPPYSRPFSQQPSGQRTLTQYNQDPSDEQEQNIDTIIQSHISKFFPHKKSNSLADVRKALVQNEPKQFAFKGYKINTEMVITEKMLKTLKDLIQISTFHDNYFQYTTKNNYRTKQIDTQKYWKNQFKGEKKHLLAFLHHKQINEEKIEKKEGQKHQIKLFSFKKIKKEFDKNWILRIQEIAQNMDLQELKIFKVMFQGTDQSEQKDKKEDTKKELIDNVVQYLIEQNVNVQNCQRQELKESTDRVKNLMDIIKSFQPKKKRKFLSTGSPENVIDKPQTALNQNKGSRSIKICVSKPNTKSQVQLENSQISQNQQSELNNTININEEHLIDIQSRPPSQQQFTQSHTSTSSDKEENSDDDEFSEFQKNFIPSLDFQKLQLQHEHKKNKERITLQQASLTGLNKFLSSQKNNKINNQMRDIIVGAYQMNEPDILNFKNDNLYQKNMSQNYNTEKVEQEYYRNQKYLIQSPKIKSENLFQIITNSELSQIQNSTIKTIENLNYVNSPQLKQSLINDTFGVKIQSGKTKEVQKETQIQSTIRRGQNLLARWDKQVYSTFNYNRKELRERAKDIKKFRPLMEKIDVFSNEIPIDPINNNI